MTKQKLILYKMNHKLKDAVHLPKNALTLVTDEDIDAYEVEFESDFQASKNQDSTTMREAKNSVLEGVTTVFGRDSKQYKYVERNLRLEPSVVGNHYGVIPTPSQIRRLKENATDDMKKNGGFTIASGGVDSSSMKDIDDAIRFLIENGFEYGKDFSSHNAVSVATALIPEKIEDYVEALSPCPSGYGWSLNDDIYSDTNNSPSYGLECEETCHSTKLDYDFTGGTLEINLHTPSSEEIN